MSAGFLGNGIDTSRDRSVLCKGEHFNGHGNCSTAQGCELTLDADKAAD
jgi:hypothetical protein